MIPVPVVRRSPAWRARQHGNYRDQCKNDLFDSLLYRQVDPAVISAAFFLRPHDRQSVALVRSFGSGRLRRLFQFPFPSFSNGDRSRGDRAYGFDPQRFLATPSD